MKKIIRAIVLCFMFVFTLAGCSNINKEISGRYNLSLISGMPGVSADMYEYYYIELKEDGTFIIESKIEDVELYQKGQYEINEEENLLSLTIKENSTSETQEATYDKNAQTITINTNVGSYYTITFVFTKESNEQNNSEVSESVLESASEIESTVESESDSVVEIVVPKQVIGKYDLTQITGISGVSPSSYDYNYIILNEKSEYYIENKINGIVTSQSGHFRVNDSLTTITFYTPNGSSSVIEQYKYDIYSHSITITSGQISFRYVMQPTEK